LILGMDSADLRKPKLLVSKSILKSIKYNLNLLHLAQG